MGVNAAQSNQQTDSSHSVTSSGSFIPIDLLPSGQTSSKLSVKLLASPSQLSSPPAMTITFLGPDPPSAKPPVASPALDARLSVALFALCQGILQASLRYRIASQTIRSWIREQERELLHRKWRWKTEKLAEWVLVQREQQLEVRADAVLEAAKKALGTESKLVDRYCWSIDFMLRHKLSLRPMHNNSSRYHHGRLPRSLRERSFSFIQSLTEQVYLNTELEKVQQSCALFSCISEGVLPLYVNAADMAAKIRSSGVSARRFGSMDELPIFIDMDQFSAQNLSALKFSGSAKDKPVFDVVLSALSDGTFLSPLLFFRGNPTPIPEGFPDNVFLEARQEGFTDQERHEIWISKVWRPRVVSRGTGECVMMADIHRDHLTEEFRRPLSLMSTDTVFIPSGCSCRLQPLDICVTPVLKDFLLARWVQLVTSGGLDGLGLDQLALTLACWFSEVSYTLSMDPRILRSSFASACRRQEVGDPYEAWKMIRVLTDALVQPVEKSKFYPEPDPEQEMELLLVVEEERMDDGMEKMREEENSEEKRMEKEEEETMREIKEENSDEQSEEEMCSGSPSALFEVFESESEPESFYGFE